MARTIMRNAVYRIAIVTSTYCVAACGDLTRVSAPDLLQPSDLDNPAGARARRAFAIASFATAYGDQIQASGLISDELSDRSVASGQSFESDTRVLAAALAQREFPYIGLANARFHALRAIGSLQRYSPDPMWQIGELFADAGYAEVFDAENMCNGIPIATVVDGVTQSTPTLTRGALLALALSHFDSAIANAGGSDSVRNLARIGRGRALLDSGDFDGARIAVDSVPLQFMYTPPYDGVHQGNSIFGTIDMGSNASVSNLEGENGLPFVSANDQRVPIVTVGLDNNGSGPDTVYGFGIYNSAASPFPLATGVEARLVVAEAALQRGDVTTWAGTLNMLRGIAITPAMDTLPADSTTLASATMRRAVMFRERAFWLFLTGHRHGDLRRLVRQYSVPTESVFPTGLYQGGPSRYGTAVAFIPGQAEGGNPTYSGCLDQLP